MTATHTPDHRTPEHHADPHHADPHHLDVHHYRAPGWFTRNVNNRAVAFATRHGLSLWGSRVLEVPGRTTGEPQRIPVNLLDLDGEQYIVSARGNGQWVRNVRANDGRLSLRVGRHRTGHVAVEVFGQEKIEVLRAYLARWKAEVGMFFDGADGNSSDDELAAIAPKHPVFRLVPADDPQVGTAS